MSARCSLALPCLALPPSRWNAASILVSLRKSTLDEGLLGSWSRRSEVAVGDGPDGRVPNVVNELLRAYE